MHLAHPLGVKAFSYRRVKNDPEDAADLADLLRMGGLPEAWIAPHEVRELREMTAYRHKLVRSADQLQGTRSTGAGQARRHGDLHSDFSGRRAAWLDGLRLPQPYAGKVTSLRHLAGELTTEITMLEAT